MKNLLERRLTVWFAYQMCVLYSIRGRSWVRCGIQDEAPPTHAWWDRRILFKDLRKAGFHLWYPLVSPLKVLSHILLSCSKATVFLLLSWDVVNRTRCFCIIPCFLHFNHVCMFLCAGSYTTYFVFSLSLSKTCCKVALNSWVLQKRKWMCQPDCIKLCLDDTQRQNHGGFTGKCVCCSYHVLRTESQWFCSPWYLGIWADRASSSMCFRERYHSGEGTWLSLLPPRGDIHSAHIVLVTSNLTVMVPLQGLSWDAKSYYVQRSRDPEICGTSILFTTLRHRGVRLTSLTVMQLETDGTWV